MLLPNQTLAAHHFQALLSESHTQKASANELFAKSSFKDAIESYNGALSTCPNYLDYEIAVLKSNIAACHLKLEDWKEAIKAATAALDGLDKLTAKTTDSKPEEEEEADEEIVSEGAAKAEDTSSKGKREADIERIRSKALLRRARARSEQGGWSALTGAEEGMAILIDLGGGADGLDYKTLSQMSNLSAADRKIVQQQMRVLPAKTKAAQEAEMGEMMGKLKQVCSPLPTQSLRRLCTSPMRANALSGRSTLWKYHARRGANCLIREANGDLARQWNSQAVWPVDGELSDGQGREDWGIFDEL